MSSLPLQYRHLYNVDAWVRPFGVSVKEVGLYMYDSEIFKEYIILFKYNSIFFQPNFLFYFFYTSVKA